MQTSTEQAASVLASLAGSAQGSPDAQPAVRRAAAILERARLNLAYTVVRPAQNGTVTRVDQLQIGKYVTAAKPVFSLVGHRICAGAWLAADHA